MKPMKKYRVKSPLKFGGRRYEAGDTVELTDAEATQIPSHVIERIEGEAA